jgi:hypothetical protein
VTFRFPGGGDFEIPDEWLAEAGVDTRRQSTATFTPAAHGPGADAVDLRLAEIALYERKEWWDGGRFDRARFVAVLQGLQRNEPIPRIEVKRTASGNGYTLVDGYHRLHACAVLEIQAVPAIVVELPGVAEDPPPIICGVCEGSGKVCPTQRDHAWPRHGCTTEGAVCTSCNGSGAIEWP